MTRIPLNTVWLQTHKEGSNYIDVETNSSSFAALQTTSYIFGRTFNSECITPFIMQRPIAFSDEMKAKEAFRPFTEKLTARAGSMRALSYTVGDAENRQRWFLAPDRLTTARSNLPSYSMVVYPS